MLWGVLSAETQGPWPLCMRASHHCLCHCPVTVEASLKDEGTEVWEVENLAQGCTANCCLSSLTPHPDSNPWPSLMVPKASWLALSPYKGHMAVMPGYFP